MSTEIDRRTFVSGAAAVAGAAALSPLLTACGGSDTTGSKGGTSSKKGLKAALPAHVAGTAVKPDIPSVKGAVGTVTAPGYLNYPTNQVKTVSGVPGKGGTYTAIVPSFGAVPDPGNSFSRAMNKALGVNLKMKPTDGINYGSIVPTMTAAKKLPDWIQLPTWYRTINVGGLVGTQLADLTPYLSGDKIKQYPNLAAIPTGGWANAAWEDKIYGIPCFASGFALPGTTFFRRDILEAKGITADDVKSADDLYNLGKELTDAKGKVWAFDDIWTYASPFWGVPFKFAVTDGKLVHKYETDELLEALDWHHKLAKSGFMHPDALAGNNGSGKTRFYAGHTLIAGDGLGAWNLGDDQTGTAASKGYRRGAFNIFAADGKSTPSTFLNPNTTIVSYLNARLSKAQILELLEVANYLAAPFGSAEYTMVNYGVEGTHYTMVDGVPTANEAGKKYVANSGYSALASPSSIASNLGADQVTKDYCAWTAAAAQHVYKPVFLNMNITVPKRFAVADAGQAVEDAIKDCYHGIKKVSDVQAAISSWKSSGGTQMIQWHSDNVLAKFGSGQ
ncbi:Tat pathway signal sequence domain protein [Streptomyces sp. NPDC005373]|uniref:Tat pathway signal sequence domain protein n=1 Tax=Streptomyces sp. NPDC005373 TaxID=3156879 RepID=UPI0033BC3A26